MSLNANHPECSESVTKRSLDEVWERINFMVATRVNCTKIKRCRVSLMLGTSMIKK